MAATPTFHFLSPALLRALPNVELVARFLVEGLYASRHRSPYYGYTVEFKDYREYAPGDEPRTIDWKAVARTEKYYVRRFEMESNMNVVCLLDVSGSMGYRSRDGRRLTKLEYGSYLTAALCYLVGKQQDAAGLVTFDTDLRVFLPARQGRRHLFSILARLETLAAGAQTDVPRTLARIAQRLPRRGIIVLVSDCHGEPATIVDGVRQLMARGHEVIVFQVLDYDEVAFPFSALASFRDVETGHEVMCDPLRQRREYSRRLDQDCRELRNGLAAAGADYRRADTTEPLEVVLRDYLLYRRQRG